MSLVFLLVPLLGPTWVSASEPPPSVASTAIAEPPMQSAPSTEPAEVDQDPPLPGLAVDWRKGRVRLAVAPPNGEHVAPDAPARLRFQAGTYSLTLETEGERFQEALGLSLVVDEPLPFVASLELALCTDTGSSCRQVQARFEGTLANPRGSLKLDGLPITEERDAPPRSRRIETSLDHALAAAAQDGLPILLDFSAVWCPPCNQFMAEIISNPAHRDLVAGYHVVSIDADRVESWKDKSRHAVTGYPTIIILDQQGQERGRTIGYPGEGAMVDWMQRSLQPMPDLEERLAAGRAGTLPVPARGVLALDLLRAGREDEAREILGTHPVEGAAGHLASLSLDGKSADALWLIKNDPRHIMDWLWDIQAPVQADASLRQAVVPLIQDSIVHAKAAEASELLSFLAEVIPEQASTLASAAAALQRTLLTGDSLHDRAYWSNLVHLLLLAGDKAEAEATLKVAIAAWPSEFTWQDSLSRFLLDEGRFPEAEDPARKALDGAYGDQRLRAAMTLARVLQAQGRGSEGAEILTRELAAFPRPDAGLQVRSTRYLDEAEELRAEMAAPPR